jgi:poly(hydroxyalkanoate) granule-associated protein
MERSMAKKLKALAKDDTQLVSAVLSSAQQIWQAGLGAYAKAQEEGGHTFAKLVEEGTALQQRGRGMAEDSASGAEVAARSWDKLEQIFEERVQRALGSIGAPTRNDIQELNARIEQLSRAVEKLSGAKAIAKVAAKAAAKPAAKAVAKPAAKAVANAQVVSKAAAKPVVKAVAKARRGAA